MGPTHSVDFPSQREGGLELPGVETGALQALDSPPPSCNSRLPAPLIPWPNVSSWPLHPKCFPGETATILSKGPVPTSAVPYGARHAAFSLSR